MVWISAKELKLSHDDSEALVLGIYGCCYKLGGIISWASWRPYYNKNLFWRDIKATPDFANSCIPVNSLQPKPESWNMTVL